MNAFNFAQYYTRKGWSLCSVAEHASGVISEIKTNFLLTQQRCGHGVAPMEEGKGRDSKNKRIKDAEEREVGQ